MPHRTTALIAAAAVSLCAGRALADASPVGTWYTSGKSAKVRIAPCGQKLCGTITWIDTRDGAPASSIKDEANPNPALRNRPIVGLVMMRDFSPAGPGRWTGGKIYDPNSGRTYDSKMSLSANGGLRVEGCVTVICQAQAWSPAD